MCGCGCVCAYVSDINIDNCADRRRGNNPQRDSVYTLRVCIILIRFISHVVGKCLEIINLCFLGRACIILVRL